MHSAHQRHRAGVGHVGLVGGDGLLAYLQVHIHELVRERGELIAEAHLQTKKILMFLSQIILIIPHRYKIKHHYIATNYHNIKLFPCTQVSARTWRTRC